MENERQTGTAGSWSELTDDVVELTERLRGTYRRVADETGPSEEEIKQALRTLAGAWTPIAGAVGTAFQDEETKAHLKNAAKSLARAVGATLSEVVPTPSAEDEP